MFPFLLALCPFLPLDTPAAPDVARIKAAVLDLDKAFKDGGIPERLKAIESGAQLVDPEIIDRISKALRDKDTPVQRAAIEALRFMDHAESTKSLVDAAKREPRLKKDVELYAALLRAIGQHSEPGSIDVLTEDFWTTTDAEVTRARILSLGRVRAKVAVEKLFELMHAAGPYKVQPHMAEFRTSLMLLTGQDLGVSQEAWMKWWNENRGKLDITPKPAALPKEIQYAWDVYWGEKKGEERPKKRSDRGKDDPAK